MPLVRRWTILGYFLVFTDKIFVRKEVIDIGILYSSVKRLTAASIFVLQCQKLYGTVYGYENVSI